MSITGSAASLSIAFSGDLAGGQNGANVTVTGLQTFHVSNSPPINGQVLKYNSNTVQWEPTTEPIAMGGGGCNRSARCFRSHPPAARTRSSP